MKTKFRIPISFKLIFLTIFLLAITTVIIAVQSASRFEEISADREEQASRDQTRALASEVDGLMLTFVDKAKVVGSLLMKDTGTPEEREKALDFSFYRDRDLVAIEVITKTPNAEPMRVVNEKNLKADEPGLDKSFIDVLRQAQKARGLVKFEKLFAGVDGYFEVRNSFIKGGAPLVTIGFPLAKDDNGVVTHIVLAEIGLSRLQKIFAPASGAKKAGEGEAPESLIFLVDSDGGLLAHSEKQSLLTENPQAMKEAAIVKTALASALKQGQQRFEWSGKPYISVYTKTAFGVSAVRMVDAEVISKAARAVKREAFYVAGRILSVALFAIFVFSITLTSPIEALAELANRVAKGDFSTKASVRSHDEVGELGEAFNHMIEGLVERDKVKNMFSKFHGSSVTDDLLKGDLQLGGSKKVVTVFFSDVRDFTKFSEGHTPEEVVEMLNEYFQIMVRIINEHGGVVDKFIGDAIMAVWGAPNATDRDTQNAVKAAIEMRKALAVLNEKRAARGHVPIKIGIGLHRGEAISGTIGSSERMEYTVIGDTVNQASRIESSTKAFGTDLLISDSLANFVQEEFIVEEAGRVEVKGKSEPLILFKVRGYYDEQKNPILVRTEFSDYEAGDADKVKMAS